jgi:hypothetical protein
MRRVVAICAVGLMAVPAVVVASARERSPHPPRATATAGGRTVRAALGSYCYAQPRGGGEYISVCADYAYPLHPRGRLRVTPGSVVTVDMHARIRKLQARLVRAHGNRFRRVSSALDVRPSAGRRRWKVQLPARLHGATALDLFAVSRRGDADYWAGLRAGGSS